MRNYRKRELWLVSLILWLGLGMSFAAEPRYLNIVFVGNSITYGAGLEEPRREAPPVRAANSTNGKTGVPGNIPKAKAKNDDMPKAFG